ncbi:MAG: hypothetical protein U5L06_00650 [Rhodovibrio sp.]|nr:hypothetical protein [Rhodovibrio sp.]
MSSKLDKSHVVIETKNETYKLAYNVKAIRAVSREFGGLRAALDQVHTMNFDAIRSLIVTGASLEKKDARELDDEIAATGLVELVDGVTKYAMLLFTGKHPDYEDEDEDNASEADEDNASEADEDGASKGKSTA